MTGLYRQTFRQKPTIKLAPDAVVHINSLPEVEICPSCKGKMVISDYITTITTSLANNTTVGSASFTISIPRHGHQGTYMVRGGRVFGINLMDEVDIYIKGRYAIDEKGNRQYYKVFWGMITNIQESYSDGYQNITVTCESILKWLQMMNTNEHPSALALGDTSLKFEIDASFWAGKSFANKNVYEIIYSMVNITFQNIVIPAGGLDTENNDVKAEGVNTNTIHPKDIEVMKYWRERFAKVKSGLRMFGTSEDSFIEIPSGKDDAGVQSQRQGMSASKNALNPIKINYNSKALLDFRPFFKPDDRQDVSLFNNSYKNNLEIINEVKNYCGFEFYLDTTGELIFKPPFWNLDTSNNKTFTIAETDILAWDFSEDANQVITRVDVTGSHFQEAQAKTALQPRATFTDWTLARQFGIKSEQIDARFFTTARLCYYHAISEMDRINSNRFSASMTILGRPELRLGYPVYIPSRDIYAYVDNISHNFTFGGQFSTQIELSSIRRKYLGDSTLASQLRFLGEGSQSVGYIGKPAILINVAEPDIDKSLASLTKEEAKSLKDKSANQTFSSIQRTNVLHKDRGANYKTNRNGEYLEFLLQDPLAQKLLRDAQSSKDSLNPEAYLNFLEVAIPISDEAGYELIGSYENGRCLELTDDNILKKKASSFAGILEKVLNKTDKQASAISTGISVVEVRDASRSSSTGTMQEAKENALRTEREVANFSKTIAKSLRDLSPVGKDIKACNCYDAALTTNLKSALKTVSDSKPMQNAGVSGGNVGKARKN